jgi:hypothetical protein
VEQWRQAQAVLLSLDHGLSLLQKRARVIGVSPGWVCQLRRRFMQREHGLKTRQSRYRRSMPAETR